MDVSKVQNVRFARKAFFVYAVNGVAASVGVALATICDAVVVGNAFGELGLAITSVVMPLYTLYNFVSYALGIGSSSATSRAFGQDDMEGGQGHFVRGFTLTLLMGVLMAVLGALFLPALVSLLGGGGLGEVCLRYVRVVVLGAPLFVTAPVLSLMLRADGDPGRSTAGIIVSSVVNLLLDLVFLFGLNMGVEGAAWAMVIGQACAVAIYLPHFLKKSSALRLGLAVPTLRQCGRLVGDGLGTASSYAWQFIYLSVFNHLLSNSSGQQGLAVFNLVFNLSMLAYAVFDGVSLSVPSLAGTYLGERDFFGLSYIMGLAVKAAFCAALVLSCLLFLFAGPVVTLFGITDPEVLSTGVAAARLYCLVIPLACLTSMLCASWQVLGHHKQALLGQFIPDCLILLGAGIPLINWLGGKGVVPALLVGKGLGLLAALLLALLAKRKLGLGSLLLPNQTGEQAAVYEGVLDGDFQRLPEIVARVEAFCEENEIPLNTAYSIQLTIEELAANIIRFGFHDRKKHYIAFKIAKYDEDIYVRIRDDATAYDPFSRTVGEGEELDMLGIELVRRNAKDFIYQRRLVFNNLLIIL